MKSIRPILFLLAFFAAAATCFAVPAKPGLLSVEQPDGTFLQVKLIGDEHFSMYLTPEGCPMLPDGKNFTYARISEDGRLVSTGVRVRSAELRTVEEQHIVSATDHAAVSAFFSRNARAARSAAAAEEASLRKAPSRVVNSDRSKFLFAEYPTIGSPRTLVILVEYQDVRFTVPSPNEFYTRYTNEVGFSDNGATGSVRDFFVASSCGQFAPQFDVYGPVVLPNNRAYYGGNMEAGESAGDGYAWKMITEACEMLDDEIDFTLYDENGDGAVDNIYVIFAGVGQASSGLFESVWPFAGYVTKFDKTKQYRHDGMLIDRFATSNEWVSSLSTGGNFAGIGTIVHEFSHVLGLPDLYSTNGSNSLTPGIWSTLDVGPYNNDERTPPLYSSFERYCVGWLTPKIIEDAENAILGPIDTNQAYMIPTGSADEFYLLENRQQVAWDYYLPAHGMLVWHIDYDQKAWSSNGVNNDETHQRVDVVEADGRADNDTKSGDTFPGLSRKTEFSDDSEPSMLTWAGTRLSLPLTEITEHDNAYISFKVLGGLESIEVPSAPVVTATTGRGFSISWEPVDGATNYSVTVMDADSYRIIPGFDGILSGGATTMTLTGLESSTRYRVSVAAMRGKTAGLPSDYTTATTAEFSFTDEIPVALEAENVTADSFTARWELLDEADGYLLTVFTKEQGEPYYYTEGFDNGVAALPEGWSASSKVSYSMASYAGEDIPSLRLSKDGDYIETSDYAEGVRSLSFWHRGNGVLAAKNSIRIFGRLDGEWSELGTCSVETAEGGKTLEINVPAGYTAFRIEYLMESSASIAIDDIRVGYGSQDIRVELPEYASFDAGNASSAEVRNLEGTTGYYYVVKGTSGSRTTLESNEVAVRTLGASSVNAVESAGTLRAVVADGVINISCAPGSGWIVADIAGVIVARGTADENGRAAVAGLSAGIYLLSDTTECIKVSVR